MVELGVGEQHGLQPDDPAVVGMQIGEGLDLRLDVRRGVEQEPLLPVGADRDRRLGAWDAGPRAGPHRATLGAGAVPLRKPSSGCRSQHSHPHDRSVLHRFMGGAPGGVGPAPCRDRLVGLVPDGHVGGHLGGHPDLRGRGGFPLLQSAAQRSVAPSCSPSFLSVSWTVWRMGISRAGRRRSTRCRGPRRAFRGGCPRASHPSRPARRRTACRRRCRSSSCRDGRCRN